MKRTQVKLKVWSYIGANTVAIIGSPPGYKNAQRQSQVWFCSDLLYAAEGSSRLAAESSLST